MQVRIKDKPEKSYTVVAYVAKQHETVAVLHDEADKRLFTVVLSKLETVAAPLKKIGPRKC